MHTLISLQNKLGYIVIIYEVHKNLIIVDIETEIIIGNYEQIKQSLVHIIVSELWAKLGNIPVNVNGEIKKKLLRISK